MSGGEKGGGEPFSGIPPTKKAPPAIHRSGPSWPFVSGVTIDALYLTNCSYLYPRFTRKQGGRKDFSLRELLLSSLSQLTRVGAPCRLRVVVLGVERPLGRSAHFLRAVDDVIRCLL